MRDNDDAYDMIILIMRKKKTKLIRQEVSLLLFCWIPRALCLLEFCARLSF